MLISMYLYVHIIYQTPGRVILKTLQMILEASLLNTQYYKVQIKSKYSYPD